MSHNGIDIDQYILLILYPSIAFFIVGLITKKKNIKKSLTYLIQSVICFIFSSTYYIFVPHGGAEGLSLILGLFGILLLLLARKEKIKPAEEESDENKQRNSSSSNSG